MLQLDLYLKNYWESQLDELSFFNYEQHFSQDEPCNIYLIGVRNRVIIDPTYVKINEGQLELKFKVQDKFEFKEIYAALDLNRSIVGELVIESKEPHSRFNVRDANGYFFDKELYPSNIKAEGKSFYALRAGCVDDTIANDLEILYIGKSLKMDATISPVKRLQSHKKMQMILNQCTQKYFDKEVYIILCAFVHKINLVTMGENLAAFTSWEALKAKMREDIEKLNATINLITQVSEAALIDYFDTREFNQDFIGAFGRESHTYYPYIKKAQISEIVLELDLRKLCNVCSKAVLPKSYHSVSYFPQRQYLKKIGEAANEFRGIRT